MININAEFDFMKHELLNTLICYSNLINTI